MRYRAFLNDVKYQGIAAVLVDVGSSGTSVWGTMEISDCSRKVELDFGFAFEDERSLQRSQLNKIKILRTALDKLETAMQAECEKQFAKQRKK